jgi:hypothetical protein
MPHNFLSFVWRKFRHWNRFAHLHESDRALRDGSFGRRCPRHFVPGYDRIVPPGHFATALAKCCGEMSGSAFHRENFKRNLRIADQGKAVAAEAGATPVQVTLS